MGKTYRTVLALVSDGGGNASGDVICIANGLTSFGKAKRKLERKQMRREAKRVAAGAVEEMRADYQDALDAAMWDDLDYDDGGYAPGDFSFYDLTTDDEPYDYFSDFYSGSDYDYDHDWYSSSYERDYHNRPEPLASPYTRLCLSSLNTRYVEDDSGVSLGSILARAIVSKAASCE